MATQETTFTTAREQRILGLGHSNIVDSDSMYDVLNASGMIGMDVQKRPMINSEGYTHKNLFEVTRIVNQETGERQVFDSVAPKKAYQPIQYEESLLDFGQALMDLGAKPKLAWTRDNGARGGCLWDLDTEFKIGDDIDPIKPQILVGTSHDSSLSLVVRMLLSRLYCTNQINMLLRSHGGSGAISIKHTGGAGKAMEQARETLRLSKTWVENFEVLANEFVQTPLSVPDFSDIASEVFTKPEIYSGEQEFTSKSSETLRDKNVALVEGIFTGQGAHGDSSGQIGGTYWAGLNALTEYYDWYRDGAVDTSDSKSLSRFHTRKEVRTAQALGIDKGSREVIKAKQNVLNIVQRRHDLVTV